MPMGRIRERWLEVLVSLFAEVARRDLRDFLEDMVWLLVKGSAVEFVVPDCESIQVCQVRADPRSWPRLLLDRATQVAVF